MKLTFQNKIQKLVVTGVFTAVLAVLSQLSIPMPTGVPVTLQTFAVALCAFALGPKLGTISVFLYLVMGAVGIPIFSGFSGGFGILLGMTGGFLWGFLLMALLCGIGVQLNRRLWAIVLGLSGLALCHICGTFQFMLVTGSPVLQSFLTASAPYLIKDVISVVLAFLAAEAILFSLKKAKVVSTK